MYKLDLNSDMGESYGAYSIGMDEELLEHITSANIACGFHGGDPATMRKTVDLCLHRGVAIGAHPGLPDLQGFGRRALAITPEEAYDIVLYQIGALSGFVQAEGGKLHHVKPHGALYHMAVKDEAVADAIAKATRKMNPDLILYGLSGSKLITAGKKAGLRCASEAFVDRTYLADGTLTPRDQANAVITDPEQAADQALRMVKDQCVISVTGDKVSIDADTICIHGDGLHAVNFACRIREVFKAEGIEVSTFD
jgi:UPF0271 protein